MKPRTRANHKERCSKEANFNEFLDGLTQLSKQTHLHVLLVGPKEELLDLYEFENIFGFSSLVSSSLFACEQYPGMDFAAAKQEYNEKYDLMELFSLTEEALSEMQTAEKADTGDAFLTTECAGAVLKDDIELQANCDNKESCRTPYQQSNFVRIWTPISDEVPTQALAVSYYGESEQITRSLFESLLEDRLQGLIDEDRQEALRLMDDDFLEVSTLCNPDVWGASLSLRSNGYVG